MVQLIINKTHQDCIMKIKYHLAYHLENNNKMLQDLTITKYHLFYLQANTSKTLRDFTIKIQFLLAYH